MPRGFLIGRLFGTDIYCAPGFFLLLGLYFLLSGPLDGATFSVAVLCSLLVHEFGHVFAVKWFLRAQSTVVLWVMGGLCVHPPTRSAGRQVGISLMGPAFGFALCALALGARVALPATAPVLLHTFLWMMIWINGAWTLVNLLPIIPLDGGQALRAALGAKMGRGPAGRVMRIVSIAASAAAMVGSYLLGLPILTLVAAMLLLQNINNPGVAYR